MRCVLSNEEVSENSKDFTIYSHIKGKEYAGKAVEKIEKEIEVLKAELTELPPEIRSEFLPVYNEKMSLLAIANYNLASQHEFLEEYSDSIIRYELALAVMASTQSAKERDNPLMREFIQSLKQVKIRAAAYQMKRPDRTFTNLSKLKVEQSHIYKEFMLHGGHISRALITSPSS